MIINVLLFMNRDSDNDFYEQTVSYTNVNYL